MEQINRKIDELYTSIFVKFTFFLNLVKLLRSVIDVLVKLTEAQAKSTEILDQLTEKVEAQDSWNKEMLEVLKELAEKTSPPDLNQPKVRSSAQILQDRYNAYMEKDTQ